MRFRHDGQAAMRSAFLHHARELYWINLEWGRLREAEICRWEGPVGGGRGLPLPLGWGEDGISI